MTLHDIKAVQRIISDTVNDDEGVFLNEIWVDICNANLDFNLNDSFKALMLVLRFLIRNEIAELIGYDDIKKNNIRWSGGNIDELSKLEDYLLQFTEKAIKKNPNFLFQFKYLSVKGKIPYLLELEKYDLN